MVTPQLETLSARLGDVKLETQAFINIYTARLAAFQAAAVMCNPVEMEALRVELHGIVDSILDSTAMDGLLNRQVMTGLHDLRDLSR